MVLLVWSHGAGGSNWYVGPLMMLVPMLLNSGGLTVLPQAVLNIVSMLLGFGGFWSFSTGGGTSSARAGSDQRQRQQQPQQQQQEVSTWQLSLFWSIMVLAASYICFRLSLLARTQGGLRRGGWRTVLQALFTGVAGGNARHAMRGAGRSAPPPPRVSLDAVAEKLQKMPTELYATKEELERFSVAELKARLRQRGVDCHHMLEKSELISKLLDDGGSSATACGICCEDYASGDAVRVLPCGHRFHIECVDQWLLKSTDYSRAPACPFCNKAV